MNNVGFFEALKRMWKKTFCYEGTSNRSEFWYPFIFQMLLAAIGILFWVLFQKYDFDNFACKLLVYCIAAYSIVSVFPWISLFIRRLHDVGKSGWLCCLLFAIGIGLIMLLFICVPVGSGIYASGIFKPEENIEADVYGPPIFEEEPINNYQPEDNENETIYGPPEMM